MAFKGKFSNAVIIYFSLFLDLQPVKHESNHIMTKGSSAPTGAQLNTNICALNADSFNKTQQCHWADDWNGTTAAEIGLFLWNVAFNRCSSTLLLMGDFVNLCTS